MSEATDRYALPLLQVAQAQKEVTHNEALAAVDALLHLAVETLTLAVPPSLPVIGAAWIVGPSPSGTWSGQGGNIASFASGGWRFAVPREGCVAWLRDTQRFAVRTAAGWRDDGWPAAGLRVGTRLALSGNAPVIAPAVGGTIIDSEVRAALGTLLVALRGQAVIA